MLDREELRELASAGQKDFYVSLYLNVDPLYNLKGDYAIHLKNMVKEASEPPDKEATRAVAGELRRIEEHVLSNRGRLRKGLAIISCPESGLWREYHLQVPVRNELVVDRSPHTKPLVDVLDNYQRYAVLLVDKESARIFVIHLGEIVEYGEVHTPDIPGKNKKGGWFALSQDHYERHVDYHVSQHLKDVVEKLDSFLSGQEIRRLIIGGSDEAVSMVKGMLHKTVLDRLVGSVRVEMFAKPDEVLRRVEPVVAAYERQTEEKEVEILLSRALKNENAVVGLADVLTALQEQRVMKLLVTGDYKAKGLSCGSCGSLSVRDVGTCPYCGATMELLDNIVEMAVAKAIQQAAVINVVPESRKLSDAGGIGAFLRF